MSLTSTTRGWKGRGRFTVRPLAGGRPFELGNVVSLNESIEVERSSRADFKNAAGGELDVDERITSFTFEAVADDITPQNIALGLAGTYSEVASAAVPDEEQNAWPQHRIAYDYLPDGTDPTVEINATAAWQASTAYAVGDMLLDTGRAYLCTVAGTSDSSEPTWPTDLSTVADNDITWKDCGAVALVKDTDYSVTANGILMLAAADTRFSGDLAIPLVIDYTKNAQYLIQALVSIGAEYEVIWHGLNAVDGGNPITSRYFRAKFSPTSGFSRHGGDEFAQLTLSGTVLEDSTRTGTGLSKYNETAMI